MAVYKSKKPTKDGRQYYFIHYKKNVFGENKKYKSKKYLRRKDAEAAEANFILSKTTTPHTPFQIVADDFFNHLSKIKKESTLYTYRKDYKNHIEPYFNRFYVDAIDISNVRAWATEMDKKGLSTSYKNKIYNILKLIMDHAIIYYGLKVNYVTINGRFQEKKDKVIEQEKIRYITHQDFIKFISIIDVPLWHAFFMFAYYTGCRKGEIFALTWKDINFDTKNVRINKTLNEEIKGKYVITSTKNNKIRNIQMNKALIDELILYKNEQQNYTDFNENWFVFGGTVHLSKTTVDRYKHKYFTMANVKEITMHEFRHSHVSLIINEYIKSGQTDTTKLFLMMSDRMGHTIEVMEKTYLHLFANVQDEIVNILDNI